MHAQSDNRIDPRLAALERIARSGLDAARQSAAAAASHRQLCSICGADRSRVGRLVPVARSMTPRASIYSVESAGKDNKVDIQAPSASAYTVFQPRAFAGKRFRCWLSTNTVTPLAGNLAAVTA
jgi:hypothetical protein